MSCWEISALLATLLTDCRLLLLRQCFRFNGVIVRHLLPAPMFPSLANCKNNSGLGRAKVILCTLVYIPKTICAEEKFPVGDTDHMDHTSYMSLLLRSRFW
jgi:hypothetical protein